MSKEEVKVEVSDRRGQSRTRGKDFSGYRDGEGQPWTRTERGLSACVYVCLPPLLYIQQVSGSKVTSVTHLGSERERMDIDGWFHGLCRTLACRLGQVFFSWCDRGMGGRTGTMPCFWGKTGSRKENKNQIHSPSLARQVILQHLKWTHIHPHCITAD